ncbi:MAG: GNAT family N-acetyltransferase [Methylococcus sp.]|nr:GNAT family N-acetyltransferase [Methylococcus sp.]
MIRAATENDAESIVRIYNHYVLNTTITFEEESVSSQDMASRIAEVASNALPWLVLEQGNEVVGYAYASKWKGRCAYRFSVETTVYLAPGLGGRGLGSKLYEVLLTQLREKGFHAAIGGIALPNPQSIALHEKFGMTKVAHFKEVGFKFRQWLDVGYWECLL